MPAISICVPCYKSERFIRTTIESALAQTVPAYEILISDDNSPDRTYEITNEYCGAPGVRIMRPPQRLSIGEHYRFLLQQASGDYICFLSHDDALSPTFIQTMHTKLEEGVALVVSGCLDCSAQLVPYRVRGLGLPAQTLKPPQGYLHFWRGCGYSMSFSLMARQYLLEFPPLPPAADLATDWYWAMMLGLRGKVKFVRRPLGYYRFHNSNSSHSDPDRCMSANAAMLEILQNQVGAEFGQDVVDRARQLRLAIARQERAEGTHKSERVTLGLKAFVKELVALPYRRLPKAISRAERGIATAHRRSSS